MTDGEIKQHKADIDKLSQKQMARLIRFAPSGHSYFQAGTGLPAYFEDRFLKLGGMTPEISKAIGW